MSAPCLTTAVRRGARRHRRNRKLGTPAEPARATGLAELHQPCSTLLTCPIVAIHPEGTRDISPEGALRSSTSLPSP